MNLNNVEFLISEQVQNMIWEKFRSAPVRVSSLASVDIAPAGELLLYLRSCRENPKSYPPPVGSVMLPYFEQYLSGSVTREKILENILRFYISVNNFLFVAKQTHCHLSFFL